MWKIFKRPGSCKRGTTVDHQNSMIGIYTWRAPFRSSRFDGCDRSPFESRTVRPRWAGSRRSSASSCPCDTTNQRSVFIHFGVRIKIFNNNNNNNNKRCFVLPPTWTEVAGCDRLDISSDRRDLCSSLMLVDRCSSTKSSNFRLVRICDCVCFFVLPFYLGVGKVICLQYTATGTRDIQFAVLSYGLCVCVCVCLSNMVWY